MIILYKFYSKFLRKGKVLLHQILQRTPLSKKYWLDKWTEKEEAFLAQFDGVEFATPIEEVQGLRKELNEIYRRLSILEKNERQK